MKKIKLLSTILGGGTLICAAPIIATSCSSGGEQPGPQPPQPVKAVITASGIGFSSIPNNTNLLVQEGEVIKFNIDRTDVSISFGWESHEGGNFDATTKELTVSSSLKDNDKFTLTATNSAGSTTYSIVLKKISTIPDIWAYNDCTVTNGTMESGDMTTFKITTASLESSVKYSASSIASSEGYWSAIYDYYPTGAKQAIGSEYGTSGALQYLKLGSDGTLTIAANAVCGTGGIDSGIKVIYRTYTNYKIGIFKPAQSQG